MKQLLRFMERAGKSLKGLDIGKVGKNVAEAADSAKTAVKAGGQYASETGKKVFKKFPKAGSAAAGAAAGAGTMAAVGDDDEDDKPAKKKKKRPYLDD